MKPKFSIIIPAHNEEEVIERAIKSVQHQTFKDFEIIVSNDGSTDKTREIVEKMMKKDKRIKISNRDKGHSAAFARNKGAEIAKGEILVFLDADAYLESTFLKSIVQRPNLAEGFINNALPLGNRRLSLILTSLIKETQEMKHLDIFSKDSVVKPFIFNLKRDAFKKIGGYSEKIFYFEDEDFTKRFYDMGFKSIYLEGAKMCFELPSTFSEFLRQCKWIGKGINTLPEKNKKIKAKLVWFLKTIFLLTPLAFVWNFEFFLILLAGTFLTSYAALVKRNKKPFLSLIAMPFLYIKTFLVSFNIFKFWKT